MRYANLDCKKKNAGVDSHYARSLLRIRLFDIVSWDFLPPFNCLIFLFTAFDGVEEFLFDTRVGEDGECRAVDTIVLFSAGKVKEAAAAPGFFFFAFIGCGVYKHLLSLELSLVHPHRASTSFACSLFQ